MPQVIQMPELNVTEAIDALQKGFTGLAEVVKGLVEAKNKPVESVLPKLEQAVATPTESQYPIPLEYRDVVHTVLNAKFGIHIEALSDSPAFRFIVVVPENYSNVSDEYRRVYKEDLRPKVISYAEGINGVRDWCERVYNSFNQDRKTQIAMDRIQG